MGQKEKAAAIVEEQFNFSRRVPVDAEQVFDLADRVASQTKVRLGGSLARIPGLAQRNDTKLARYCLKGPGGMVNVATISLTTSPSDGGTGLKLSVDDFLYQKSSLGMKPTINGAKQIGAFVSTLRAELDALGA